MYKIDLFIVKTTDFWATYDTIWKMALFNGKIPDRTVRFMLTLIFTAMVFLIKSSNPEFLRVEDNVNSKNTYIASKLVKLPHRLCLLWLSTRDNVLRKHNFALKNNNRYGLQFHVANNMAHLTLRILLAGDVATNPGPSSTPNHAPNLQRMTNDRKFSAKCLIVNARSLLSVRKSEGKRSRHLPNFQELAYTEDADIIWVAQTWLKDNVESREILPWGYTIYRKDRKSRAGGVLLAVKSSSLSYYLGILDLNRLSSNPQGKRLP